jgi:regulatory protein spx
MIKIYTAPSCLSCRKVKKYFKDHNIKFVEKNILQTPLTRDDIYRMLIQSENGFDDIISMRSKVFKEKNINLDDMNLNQLIDFIIENPSILKRPIILSDLDLQVGYNAEDISLFLPPELRDCEDCKDDDCEYAKYLRIEKK